MIKQIKYKYFISPYICLLYIGFFLLIISLIGFIIYYSINNKFSFTDNFHGESLTSIIYLIWFLIFGIIYNVLNFLVIYYFSPTLLMITDIINPIINWIVKFFIEKKDIALIIALNVTGCSILFISSLIYNEFIIFNFCGLNKSTKKFLEKKQREELSSILENDDGSDDEPNERESDTK